MNEYQFLSEIYRLLGDLTPETLKRLDRTPLPDELKRIVDAFVSARRRGVLFHTSSQSDLDLGLTTAVASIPSSILDSPIARATVDFPNRPEIFLEETHAKLSNTQFESLLNRAGLVLHARDKETRSQFLQKAIRAFNQLPGQKQSRVIRNILRFTRTDETQGWIDAIRSAHRP